MAERAIELLSLPEDQPSYILDVGCVCVCVCVCVYPRLTVRCGSGLSGEALSEAGHYWVGLDISQSMLSESSCVVCMFVTNVGSLLSPVCAAVHSVCVCVCVCVDVAREREVEGDLFLCDVGDGVGFRPGTFDGVISVSALQWLCNADKKSHNPLKRLYRFFSSLYACLVCTHSQSHSTAHSTPPHIHRQEEAVLYSSSILRILIRWSLSLGRP